MKLDERTVRLIAVGASISANCRPCLTSNAKKALENGADEQQIAEAMEIGKMVRKGAASKMDQCAASLGAFAVSAGDAPRDECGCG